MDLIMDIKAKRVQDSMAETVHIVRPNHLNGANRLFGGILMQWIDEVAGIVAKRHAMMNVTTASVDNLRFMKGAYQNEMVVIVGRLTYVGKTSMEVRVDTYVENKEGVRKAINSAYFVMVALDENDRPVTVPQLIIETEEQKAEYNLNDEMYKELYENGGLAFHLKFMYPQTITNRGM